MRVNYIVDEELVEVEIEGELVDGDDRVIADAYNDPIKQQPWYQSGYTVTPLLNEKEHSEIRGRLCDIISESLNALGCSTDGFTLEKYHNFATEYIHQQLIQRTRRLAHDEIGFDFDILLERLSQICGSPLTIRNPLLQQDHWVICRIYRPKSPDINPVHKDIYEAVDQVDTPLRMVNFWLPICGVSGKTGLPIASGTHLLPESQIERFRSGSTMNGIRYSVSAVAGWGGSRQLTSVVPSPGEVLAFSSHIIHGLALNRNEDTTRISLEFRLFD